MRIAPAPSSTLRNRIREARHARGLTQQQLAELAGISHPVVVWLERDKGHAPLAQTMLALADALGVEFGWLWYAERSVA